MPRMRLLRLAPIILGIGIAACSSKPPAPAPAQPTETIDVRFSPKGGCTDAIIAELNRARSSIRFQAYSFTSTPIAKAVIDARKRGVRVEALLDKSNRTNRYSAATFLKNQGADVLIDARHAIAHNKIILIDERVIITGSFNFTNNAEESNAENLLIIRDNPGLIAKYLANFAEHRKHSESYEAPGASATEGLGGANGSAAQQAAADGPFVGSRNSKVYHYPNCSAVRTISPENLVEYQSAPPGKRLHTGCPQ